MKDEHIPEILNTGCFINCKLLRMIETDDTDGPTYAAQYFAINKSLYNTYIDKYSSQMRLAGIEKWGNNFMAFRTLLQVVH